jgi:hypothetical protein
MILDELDAVNLALAMGVVLATDHRPDAVTSSAVTHMYAVAHPQLMRRHWVDLIAEYHLTGRYEGIREALLGLDRDYIEMRRHMPFLGSLTDREIVALKKLATDLPRLLQEREKLAEDTA